MGAIIAAAALAATLAVIVGAHELGHVLAGRAIGLPRGAQKIVFGLPISSVALRLGDDWIGPEDGRYRATFRTLVPDSPRRAFVYGVGGLAGQTTVVVVVAALSAPFSATREIGDDFARFSILFLLSYFALDAIGTRRTGRPSGDASALWLLSKGATIGSILAVLGAHAGVVALLP